MSLEVSCTLCTIHPHRHSATVGNYKSNLEFTNSGPRMEGCSLRAALTGEEALHLLDKEGEDGGQGDMFFVSTDEEFGFSFGS